jgi:hypothetical protein
MKLIKETKNSSRRKSSAAPIKSAPIEAPAVPQLTATTTSALVPDARVPGRGGAKTVTIEAKIDVGFGNALFVRGEGRGLSWERGQPLVCVDGSTWKFTTEAEQKMEFKLLLNDSVWSKGENLTAAPGQRVEVAPSF